MVNENFGSPLRRSVSSEERNFFFSFAVSLLEFTLTWSVLFSLFRGYFPRYFLYFLSSLFVPQRVEFVLLLLLSLSLSFLACIVFSTLVLQPSKHYGPTQRKREDHHTQTIPCEWLVLLFWSALWLVGTNTSSNSKFEGNFLFDRRPTS